MTTEFPAGGIERTDGREYRRRKDDTEAENALKAAKRELLEETEFLNVERYSMEEIERMIREGEFQQSVHIMAWLLANRGDL